MSDIHALSGAYAVDALDDTERVRFEQHLAGCEACRGEVQGLREAASLLAETTLTAPSPGLRDRVLGEIATVRPLPPVQRGDATVTPLAPRRRRFTAFLVAAAAVVAVGTGGIVWQQTRDDGAGDRFSQISAAGDARTFTVPVGGGSATVVVSKQLDQAYIRTDDMPAAPPEHQYVLWLQHGSSLTAAGVMPPGPDNRVLLDGDVATADGAAVSVEVAGDPPAQPSDDVVALFTFDA